MIIAGTFAGVILSHPVRGAWIEIGDVAIALSS